MKIKLKNIFLHFKKICVHKYWVGYYCFKVGLYWQGIIHDLSKFSPVEFWESVKYYQGINSPIEVSKKVNGYSKKHGFIIADGIFIIMNIGKTILIKVVIQL